MSIRTKPNERRVRVKVLCVPEGFDAKLILDGGERWVYVGVFKSDEKAHEVAEELAFKYRHRILS